MHLREIRRERLFDHNTFTNLPLFRMHAVVRRCCTCDRAIAVVGTNSKGIHTYLRMPPASTNHFLRRIYIASLLGWCITEKHLPAYAPRIHLLHSSTKKKFNCKNKIDTTIRCKYFSSTKRANPHCSSCKLHKQSEVFLKLQALR